MQHCSRAPQARHSIVTFAELLTGRPHAVQLQSHDSRGKALAASSGNQPVSQAVFVLLLHHGPHVLAPGQSAMRSHPLYRWIQALCLLVRIVMAESKLCSCVFAPPWNDRAFQEVVTKGVNTLSVAGMAIAKGKRTPEKVSWQESMACLAAVQQGSARLLRALGAASAAQE